MRYFLTLATFVLAFSLYTNINLQAQEPEKPPAESPATDSCLVSDRICILKQMEKAASTIETQTWRDQTYREIAKTYAFENKIEEAISLIDRITTPDTRAMTIRGIGMAVADTPHAENELNEIFKKLRIAADKIEDPPSYAIALTYIAMSQAFAGDDEGAWKTAKDMENSALRNKAYGETAEIQAEKGKYAAAIDSISKIDSAAFRDKASESVSKILSDKALYSDAYKAGLLIANPYKRSQALQYLLDRQKPREVPHWQDREK
jgi:hypothetical protein